MGGSGQVGDGHIVGVDQVALIKPVSLLVREERGVTTPREPGSSTELPAVAELVSEWIVESESVWVVESESVWIVEWIVESESVLLYCGV